MGNQRVYYPIRIQKWVDKAKEEFEVGASEFAQVTAIEWLEKRYPHFEDIAAGFRAEKRTNGGNRVWKK